MIMVMLAFLVSTCVHAQDMSAKKSVVVFENLSPIVAFDERLHVLAVLPAETLLEIEVDAPHFTKHFISSQDDKLPLLLQSSLATQQGELYRVLLPYVDDSYSIQPRNSIWIRLSAHIKQQRIRFVGFESTDKNLENAVNSLFIENFAELLTAEQLFSDNPLVNQFIEHPVCNCPQGCYISSKWGRRRSERTGNGRRSSRFHRGIDIASYRNKVPIIAAADGCIERVLTNPSGSFGLAIFLKHDNQYQTQYAHMSRLLIKSGCVKKGQQLGVMGQTGNATGIHLHLGLLENAVWTDPAPYMATDNFTAICQ